MDHPDMIAGYHVLPMSLPLLSKLPKPATHYLYLAPHDPKIPTPSAARSLFAVNVPFDATELHIKNLFSVQLELSHGRVEDVQFTSKKRQTPSNGLPTASVSVEKRGKKRKRHSDLGAIEDLEGAALPPTWDRDLQVNGGTAVIVFVDRASREAALKAVRKVTKHKKDITWGKGLEHSLPALGSTRYLNHHKLRYPDKSQLLKSVDTYMTAFADREKKQADLQAKRRQVPDEDGFITVTKGARTAPAKQEAAQELARKQKEKQKGLDNFYRFQMRERKKAHAVELIRRFEEDKAKVKRMREQRGTFTVGPLLEKPAMED